MLIFLAQVRNDGGLMDSRSRADVHLSPRLVKEAFYGIRYRVELLSVPWFLASMDSTFRDGEKNMF